MFDNISTKVFQNTPNEKNTAGLQSQSASSARDGPDNEPRAYNYGEHLKFSDDEDDDNMPQ